MRFVVLLSFFLSLTALGQNNLAKQLNIVVKDTITGFRQVRGAFDKERSHYHTSFQIDSTTDGKVYDLATQSCYVVEITGSASKDSIITANQLPHWKQKLAHALGPEFKIGKAKAPPGFKAYFGGGYLFTKGHLSVTLEHWKRFSQNETIHFLRIFIIYKPDS